jgi:hypothetical protein
MDQPLGTFALAGIDEGVRFLKHFVEKTDPARRDFLSLC